MKPNQPRRVIDLIQAVEKARCNLTVLESIEAIKNPLVIRSIESKLPDDMKKDWIRFKRDTSNHVTPENYFDLKDEKATLEYLEQFHVGKKVEKSVHLEMKYTSTKTARRGGCVICEDERHTGKIFFCKQFKQLEPSEKLKAAKMLGACRKCYMCHTQNDGCKDTFPCRNENCIKKGSSDYHLFLCMRGGSKGKGPRKVGET